MRSRIAVFALLFAAAAAVVTQAQQNPLRPPAGAKVALVVFEDLQCPDCANAAPLLEEAQKTYKIPLVRYDFPLPKHNWSKQAAIFARYFDTKSKALGNEFRSYCFKHQPYPGKEQPWINDPEELRQQAEQFAKAHKMTLPLAVDPQGKLQEKVEADYALGMSIGIEHTPTIYVVSDTTHSTPFVEVVDRTNLYSQIDEMLGAAGANSKPAKSSRKPGGGE